MAYHGPSIQGCHKDEEHPAGAERAHAPFMPSEQPCEDIQDLPDPRAYPKHFDKDLPTSRTEKALTKKAHSFVQKPKNPRSWPVPDKDGKPSKRKRDSHNTVLLPHQQEEHSPLDRWLDEPGCNGPYHAIDSVVPTQKPSHVTDASKEKT